MLRWFTTMRLIGSSALPGVAMAVGRETSTTFSAQGDTTAVVNADGKEDKSGDIVVTASRFEMLGKANAASEGSITADEVALRPIYRPGQLLETVPGLVVTMHSGEGKASQYLPRGFNLDHGTDFASFLDDMPINRPTNTHGQGYSDQNFIMPALIGGIDFTKGPASPRSITRGRATSPPTSRCVRCSRG